MKEIFITAQDLLNAINQLGGKIENIEKILKSNSAGEAENSELLTVEQASKMLFLAPQSVYGKLCRNELPAIKPKGSKRVYFRKSDLLEYLEAGRKKTPSEIKAEAGQCLKRKKS
jgi:excisionase family DNA binding protein